MAFDVNVRAGGHWENNKFIANIRLWGKIDKEVQITASIDSAWVDATEDTFDGDSCNGEAHVYQSVNGVSASEAVIPCRIGLMSVLWEIQEDAYLSGCELTASSAEDAVLTNSTLNGNTFKIINTLQYNEDSDTVSCTSTTYSVSAGVQAEPNPNGSYTIIGKAFISNNLNNPVATETTTITPTVTVSWLEPRINASGITARVLINGQEYTHSYDY